MNADCQKSTFDSPLASVIFYHEQAPASRTRVFSAGVYNVVKIQLFVCYFEAFLFYGVKVAVTGPIMLFSVDSLVNAAYLSESS